MRIRRRARLDPSQVSDRRGRSSGGPVAVGGGVIGLVIAIVLVLLNGGTSNLGARRDARSPSDLAGCHTGADVQQDPDCRIVAYVNSIQEYWSREVPNYTDAKTGLFTGRTSTGCGTETTQ